MHEESESQKRFATAQLVIDIEYDLNGENAEHIALLLRQAARHILDSGAVTEGSRVKINRCDVNVDVLDDDSQYLDEDDIAEFYYDRIENGAINLESLAENHCAKSAHAPIGCQVHDLATNDRSRDVGE